MTSSMTALLAPTASPVAVRAAHYAAGSGFDAALLGAMGTAAGIPIAIPAGTTSGESAIPPESATKEAAAPIPEPVLAPAPTSANWPETPATEMLEVSPATVVLDETTPMAPIAAPETGDAGPTGTEATSPAATPPATTVAAIPITAIASPTAVSTNEAASPTGTVTPTAKPTMTDTVTTPPASAAVVASPSTAPIPVAPQPAPAIQTSGSMTAAVSVGTHATTPPAATVAARATTTGSFVATAVAARASASGSSTDTAVTAAGVAPSAAVVPALTPPPALFSSASPPVTTPMTGQAAIGVGELASRSVSEQAIASSPPAFLGAHGGDSAAIAPPVLAVPVQAPVPAIAGPLPAAPAAPAAAPTFATQVSVPVFTLVGAAQGEHTLTISVTPDNLGPVTVRAHITADGIRVQLFAPTDAGRDALRAILPDLRRDLAGSGLDSSLDLSSRNEPDDSRGDNSARHRTSHAILGTMDRGRAEALGERLPYVRNYITASTIDVTV
jgi:flagellar hook-length control protein FliK